MKAVNHYVIVDKIKTEQKKVAGLIMTEDLDEDNRYLKGKVISAGNLIEFIKDGDVAGAILVTDDKYDVDIFLGIGGGPEGVLAAAALDAFGCKFQGRFLFETENDIKRARDMGIKDLDKKYELNEIIKGETVFCATGITDGDLVKGVSIVNNEFYTETFVTHTNSFKNVIKNRYPKLD